MGEDTGGKHMEARTSWRVCFRSPIGFHLGESLSHHRHRFPNSPFPVKSFHFSSPSGISAAHHVDTRTPIATHIAEHPAHCLVAPSPAPMLRRLPTCPHRCQHFSNTPASWLQTRSFAERSLRAGLRPDTTISLE